MNGKRCTHHYFALGLCVVGFALGFEQAKAQSLWDESLVGVSNKGSDADWISTVGTSDGSLATASLNMSFTGLDGSGATQTMTFSGTTVTQASYGSLHSYATGTVGNSYNNPANPEYYDSNTNTLNTSGSPDTLASLGFAGFNDVLQFGGALQSGYMARYIFHVDGTNTGYGVVADLAVNVEGYAGEGFFAFDSGHTSTNWVTQDFAINGVTPQTIGVQFSNQFVLDSWTVPDGSNLSGTSDFSDTLTLAGIEVVDANGKPVTGWTVSSASGTKYNALQSVPGPSAVGTLLVGLAGLSVRRRKLR